MPKPAPSSASWPSPRPPTVSDWAPAAPHGIRASPAVRARARELGVDLAGVRPSGPDGSVTRADVEAAAAAAPLLGGRELRGARRTMAVNMARAWREVVHATLQDDADISAWTRSEDVTCRLIRAIIAGLQGGARAERELRCREQARCTTIPPFDLGLAIDSPDGLFVPVLRDVAQSGPPQWRSQIEAIKQASRSARWRPRDLRGATITLSNFGTIAGRYAALVIMPPQVAIVGAGRITEHPTRDGRRASSYLAVVAFVRSSRAHRRRGRAIPARGHGRSGAVRRNRGEELMEDMFRFADEFGPARIVHIHRPHVGLQAIAVIDNTACGPAIGGVRMAPDVSVEECFRLARAMTWKNAAAGLPHGGGKSVIFGDPRHAGRPKGSRSCAPLRAPSATSPTTSPGRTWERTSSAWAGSRTRPAAPSVCPSAVGGIPLDQIGATGFGLCCQRRRGARVHRARFEGRAGGRAGLRRGRQARGTVSGAPRRSPGRRQRYRRNTCRSGGPRSRRADRPQGDRPAAARSFARE